MFYLRTRVSRPPDRDRNRRASNRAGRRDAAARSVRRALLAGGANRVVADLHLEKGTSYGPRGITLPPYDTAATLAALAAVLRRLRPERVICLGDSFHDGEASERIDPADRATLADLVAAHRWFWVAGNHDPEPPSLGGRVVRELAIGGLVFRHE